MTLKGLIKLVKIAGLLFFTILYSLFVRTILRNKLKRTKVINRLTSNTSTKILDILNIEVEIINPPRVLPTENYLVVANHLSYIDPILMSSILPSVFVTSVEIENTPVLGEICKAAGCQFVERRSIFNIKNELSNLTEVLKQNKNLVLYPEGTTSDGSEILPFYTSFFQAAIDSQRKILPVTINYLEVNGKKATLEEKDLYCWYADMTFAPHFFKLLSCEKLKLSIEFHPPYQTYSGTGARKKIARIVKSKISQSFYPLTFANQTDPVSLRI